MAGLSATWHLDGVLIRQGDSHSVMLRSVSGKTQALLGLHLVDRDGQRLPVSALLDAPAPQDPATAPASREEFLEVQLAQLGSLGQRYLAGSPSGAASLAVPDGVTVQTTFMVEGEEHEHGSYLRVSSRTEEVQVVERTPVYETITRPAAAEVPRMFVPVNAGVPTDGSVIAGSETPVFSSTGQMLGVWVNLAGSVAPTATETLQVGWTTTTRTETRTVPEDSAIQERIVGTAGDDVVRAGYNEDEFPVLFRGAIETGAGNDQILLNNGSNGATPQTRDGTQDWGYLDLSRYGYLVSDHYYRGLGAWIDAGEGDDTVLGTDAKDVIIGGFGADLLDGQGGADTYVFNLGDGKDVIHEEGTSSFIDVSHTDYDDTLVFGDGIFADGIALQRLGNDVLFRINANDQVTIKDWFSSSYHQIESVLFSDGTVWQPGDVAAMLPDPQQGQADDGYLMGQGNAPVSVMAAFEPPASGMIAFIPEIACNWI